MQIKDWSSTKFEFGICPLLAVWVSEGGLTISLRWDSSYLPGRIVLRWNGLIYLLDTVFCQKRLYLWTLFSLPGTSLFLWRTLALVGVSLGWFFLSWSCSFSYIVMNFREDPIFNLCVLDVDVCVYIYFLCKVIFYAFLFTITKWNYTNFRLKYTISSSLVCGVWACTYLCVFVRLCECKIVWVFHKKKKSSYITDFVSVFSL